MDMNALDTNRPVRDFAVEVPGATRLFEKYGIDYCCGGAAALADACAAKGIDVGEVSARLAELEHASASSGVDRSSWSLAALALHIVETHHTFTRSELERVERLLDKVCSVHGERHPEVLALRDTVRALTEDLLPHMLKEERVLFPFIEALERAKHAGQRPPTPPFGSVAFPVRMMRVEHDAAGALLARMRQITTDYTPPPDACLTFRTLYEALAELERDLHEHIHLENNVLFPRAETLEAELS
jgi:regulator of cell morphogenesis and NO signaling